MLDSQTSNLFHSPLCFCKIRTFDLATSFDPRPRFMYFSPQRECFSFISAGSFGFQCNTVVMWVSCQLICLGRNPGCEISFYLCVSLNSHPLTVKYCYYQDLASKLWWGLNVWTRLKDLNTAHHAAGSQWFSYSVLNIIWVDLMSCFRNYYLKCLLLSFLLTISIILFWFEDYTW